MSKISKLFKVSSSSSSSSRPTSSSGSSSRSKHRSRSGPSPQEAINRLRETEAMLTKKQEYLESRIEQELTIAKKNGTKNKRAALQALKRKKRFEQQLTQIDGTLSTIEFQREALENATTNTEVLKNMGYAAKAIKEVHQNMCVSSFAAFTPCRNYHNFEMTTRDVQTCSHPWTGNYAFLCQHYQLLNESTVVRW
ncbi:charged multivesicular body protein 4c isoform X2 [Chanodichthys erythropterus]|uniref:charged multivesicular body protein 4c isoform X2 n=1 Tax=Chanodichthys erythropterus TaxID=933992 RepID=UPI00351F2805